MRCIGSLLIGAVVKYKGAWDEIRFVVLDKTGKNIEILSVWKVELN